MIGLKKAAQYKLGRTDEQKKKKQALKEFETKEKVRLEKQFIKKKIREELKQKLKNKERKYAPAGSEFSGDSTPLIKTTTGKGKRKKTIYKHQHPKTREAFISDFGDIPNLHYAEGMHSTDPLSGFELFIGEDKRKGKRKKGYPSLLGLEGF